MKAKLKAIYVYPIKSCAGFSVKSWQLEKYGLQFDRTWMLVDQQGVFVTQRKFGKMAQIKTEIGDGFLKVAIPGIETLKVSLTKETAVTRTVSVWKSTLEGHEESREISQAFSDFLGEKLFLVRFGSASQRELTRFADSKPVLVIQEESLQELNRQAQAQNSILQFRPNLVVSGAAAFEEDQWKQVEIGGQQFDFEAKCSRCPIVSLNPESGEKLAANPLTALASFRRDGQRVYFGSYYSPRSLGRISVD